MSTKREGVVCYERAAMDEPIFVLRAQDKLAPLMVEVWAFRAGRHGCPRDKVLEALQVAKQMREWGIQHGCKLPD